MAVSVVTAGFYNESASASSITPVLPSSRINGNVLLCTVISKATAAGAIWTIPAGWEQVYQSVAPTVGLMCLVLVRPIDGTETAPVCALNSAAAMGGQVVQLSGVKANFAAVRTASGTGVTHALAAGGSALYTGDWLYIDFSAINTTIGSATGWTELLETAGATSASRIAIGRQDTAAVVGSGASAISLTGGNAAWHVAVVNIADTSNTLTTIAGLSTAVAPVGPFKIAAGTQFAIPKDVTTALVPNETASANSGMVAQSFTATSNYNLYRADFSFLVAGGNMAFTVGGQNACYAELRATNPTGALIATSSGNTQTFANGVAGTLSFEFPTSPAIANGSVYCLVIYFTNGSGGFASCRCKGSATSVYAGGTAYLFVSGTNPASLVPAASAPFDLAVTLNAAGVTNSDAYYLFGRDVTTGTTLQAYKSLGRVFSITPPDYSNAQPFGNAAASARFAQSFTLTQDCSISSITFNLKKVGAPTDNLVVDIYLTNGVGVPIGSSLGTSSTLALTTVSVSADAYYQFRFPSGFEAVAGTQYTAVCSRSGALDAANYPARCTGLGNHDPAQYTATYNQTTLTWTANSGDVAIQVYGTSVATSAGEGLASVATKTGFTTAILNLSGYQVGTTIHLLVQDGTASTALATKYVSFDALTGTFLATTETVSAAVAVTGQVAGAGAGASIVVRGNGEAVAFYSGLQTKTSGTFRSRVYYRRRTALNTWSAETQVDANAAFDCREPLAALGAADRVHLLFYDGTNTTQRVLTAANALSAATAFSSALKGQYGARSYVSGSDTYLVVCYAGQFSYSLSADTPQAWTNQLAPASGTTTKICAGPFIDGTTFHNIWIVDADSDIAYSKSEDRGTISNVAAYPFVGTALGLSKNAGVCYQRGSWVVVPYVVNDNGIWKYNEYQLPAANAWSNSDKSANLTLSNNDKTVTAVSSSASMGVRSTTTHASESAGKYYAEFALTDAPQYVGIISTASSLLSPNPGAAVVMSAGAALVNGAGTGVTLGAFANGDVASVAWDAGAELIWFRKNSGLWNNSGTADPATGVGGVSVAAWSAQPFALWANTAAIGDSVTLRTELADLTLAPPAGFKSWMGESVSVADAWNANDTTAGMSLSNGDKTSTITSPSGWEGSRSTQKQANSVAGKYYAEFKVHDTGWGTVGIKSATKPITAQQQGAVFVGLNSGNIYSQWPLNDQVYPSSIGAFVANDVLSVAWDAGAEKIWFRKNNNDWLADAAANPATGVGGFDVSNQDDANYALWHLGDGGDATSVSVRASKAEFTQTLPTGFTSWMGEAFVIPDIGTLVAGVATVAATGVVSYPPAVGTGALAAQLATSPGFGKSESVGTGALIAISLVGGPRTNVIRYSQQLDQSPWSVLNASLAADNITAPDGSLTADKLTDNTSNQLHYAYQQVGVSLPYRTHTSSVYAKAGTLSWVQIFVGGAWANFNVASGTTGQKSSTPITTSSIVAVGDGWYRCSLTASFSGTPSNYLILLPSDVGDSGQAYTGTGTGSAYFWGSQLETGSVATEYIPTTTDAVTVTAALVGTGTVSWNAVGALTGAAAAISGAGTAASPPVTGTGTLTSTVTAVIALGISRSFGTATLVAPDRTLTGAGISQVVATGALNAGLQRTNHATRSQEIDLGFVTSNTTITANTVVAPDSTTTAETVTTTAVSGAHIIYMNPSISSIPTLATGPITESFYVKRDTCPWLFVTSHQATIWAYFDLVNGVCGNTSQCTSTMTAVGDGWYRCSFTYQKATGSLRPFLRLVLEDNNTGAPPDHASVVALHVWGYQVEQSSVVSGYIPTTTAPVTVGSTPVLVTGAGVSQSLVTSAALQAQSNFLQLGSGISLSLGTGALTSVATLTGSGELLIPTGTGTLVAGVSTLAGVGTSASPPAFGTGALAPGVAALDAFGTSRSFGTAALTSNSTLTGVGTSSIAATGALTASAAVTVGPGISRSVSTSAALAAQSNFLQLGSGISSSRSTSAALAANVSVLTGVGIGNLATGTGALTSTATLAGAGTGAWVATVTLSAQVAALTGAGVRAWAASGAMPAQPALAVALGVSSSSSTSAALLSPTSTVVSIGFVATGVSGIGNLTSFATITAAGISRSVGTAGALTSAPSAIAAPGVSQSVGTGTMPSAPSALAALGLSSAVGTGALAAQAATAAGVGVSQWVATGALSAGSASIASAGLARWAASGALVSGASGVVSFGISSSRVTTAALQATVAYVSGFEGVVVISGAGTMPSQSASVAGVGRAIATGTGSLLAFPSATLTGAGLSRSEGAALLNSQASVISGAGKVAVEGFGALASAASVVVGGGSIAQAVQGTGTLVAVASAIAGAGRVEWQIAGALAAQASAATGPGVARWVATGVLPASAATASGVGSSVSTATAALQAARSTIWGYEGVVVISGAGALQAQSGSIVAPGTAEWIGGGALVAATPSLSGISVTGSLGTGVLAVSATAAMAGSGISRVEGQAALAARSATLFGAAVLVTSGAGELVAQDHALAGTGKQIADGYGVLRHTTRAEIEGVGAVGSVGFGEIVSRRALMQGFATQVARATGQLVAGNATIVGTEQVVTLGHGDIIAGAAEIVGVGTGGDATWVYEEPTALPGSYPGTSVYNPVGIAAAPTTGAASPTLPPPAWWLGNAA